LIIVVLGDERGEGVHELVGEGTLVFGRAKAHPSFECERRQLAARSRGALTKRANRSDRSARGGDEVPAGEPIAHRRRVGMERPGGAERAGTHDVEGGRRLKEVLNAVPAAAFADRAQELRCLERADVVADTLTRELECAGDTRC
jgi:hypothetical protein